MTNRPCDHCIENDATTKIDDNFYCDDCGNEDGEVKQHQSLEDVFGAGELEVWYSRREFFSFGLHGARPNRDPERLLWTHIKLGSIVDCQVGKPTEATLDKIFMELQGERWSPNGEANELISSKGLGHTSMSVGDCFRLPTGEVWIVSRVGFKRVDK